MLKVTRRLGWYRVCGEHFSWPLGFPGSVGFWTSDISGWDDLGSDCWGIGCLGCRLFEPSARA